MEYSERSNLLKMAQENVLLPEIPLPILHKNIGWECECHTKRGYKQDTKEIMGCAWERSSRGFLYLENQERRMKWLSTQKVWRPKTKEEQLRFYFCSHPEYLYNFEDSEVLVEPSEVYPNAIPLGYIKEIYHMFPIDLTFFIFQTLSGVDISTLRKNIIFKSI